MAAAEAFCPELDECPGLSDSQSRAAAPYVTDSAAGMTAIVTGRRTHNAVISMRPETSAAGSDGGFFEDVCSNMRKRGLSTGVVGECVDCRNATPAACYGQRTSAKQGRCICRSSARVGDGVAVVIGGGRQKIYEDVGSLGKNRD